MSANQLAMIIMSNRAFDNMFKSESNLLSQCMLHHQHIMIIIQHFILIIHCILISHNVFISISALFQFNRLF